MPHGLALCALHHRLLDHGAITVGEDLRCGWLGPAGTSARGLLEKLDAQEIRLPIDGSSSPPGYSHLHHREVFKGRV